MPQPTTNNLEGIRRALKEGIEFINDNGAKVKIPDEHFKVLTHYLNIVLNKYAK